MAAFSTMPFVQRLCYSLVSGALILITLYMGQHIILPIAFACSFLHYTDCCLAITWKSWASTGGCPQR